MIKAVLFDVDGTLLDTTEYIYQAFEHSLRFHNQKVLSKEEMSQLSGKPLNDCYRVFTASEEVESYVQQHKQFQHEHIDLVNIFPHTIATLTELRKQSIAIAAITNRAKMSTIQSLEITKVYPLIDFFVGVDDVVAPKPDPEGILRALTTFSIDPSEAIMVGDSPADIEAGKNAGTETVGVTYGFHGEKVRETKPDYVIADINEIVHIVELD